MHITSFLSLYNLSGYTKSVCMRSFLSVAQIESPQIELPSFERSLSKNTLLQV